MDDEIKDACMLDAVLTVVDTKHVVQHLDEQKPDGVVNEAIQQVMMPAHCASRQAFADSSNVSST